MKSFKAQKAYLVLMLVLTVVMSSSLVYGGSDERAGDHQTPEALVAAAQFAGFAGDSGMTNQGIYPVVNAAIDTGAAAPLVTGFHDTGAAYTDTISSIGTVNGTRHAAHPRCQDSCSL